MYYAQVVFFGRRVGAIGISYQIQTICNGTDKDAAHLSLYDRFEGIHKAEFHECTEKEYLKLSQEFPNWSIIPYECPRFW